ncbi:hypothetical protein FACS189454_06280 [Planctomycetales bacterium]|nr:hypothetical protein FACS189454_06280 [Planctomycetales bacterium]
MKKMFLVYVCVLLIGLAFVQTRLAAQQQESQSSNKKPEVSTPAAKQTVAGLAQKEQCVIHLKHVVLAFHNYHDVYKDALPPLYTVDKNGKPLHSWRVLILPFIEELALYKKIRLDEPWDSEYNKQFHNAAPKVYLCPSCGDASKNGLCNYSVIAGQTFVPAKKAGEVKGNGFRHIEDGTSNAIAVVELKKPFCWMDPTADITLDELAKGINKPNGKVGSHHQGGINLALFDGRVRFVPDSIPGETLKALGDPRDGKAVTIEDAVNQKSTDK